MTQDIPQENHRSAKRQRVLKDGKIVFNSNSSVINCTIRDISETGARIICDNPGGVPDECRLVTLSDNVIRDAKVMWRRGDKVGLRFTGDARRAPPRKW